MDLLRKRRFSLEVDVSCTGTGSVALREAETRRSMSSANTTSRARTLHRGARCAEQPKEPKERADELQKLHKLDIDHRYSATAWCFQTDPAKAMHTVFVLCDEAHASVCCSVKGGSRPMCGESCVETHS